MVVARAGRGLQSSGGVCKNSLATKRVSEVNSGASGFPRTPLIRGWGVPCAEPSESRGKVVKGERRQVSKWKREKKQALRQARRVLRDRYGVDLNQVNGIGSILRQIVICRPDLENLHGMARVAAFTGSILNAKPQPPAPRVTQPKKQKVHYAATDAFLQSYEWRRVRMVALKKYGARCQCCGATPADGLKMHVDHIKPRRIYPDLALDVNNLQVLCEVCNHGKGNWDMTDWRGESAIGESEQQHIRAIVEGQ